WAGNYALNTSSATSTLPNGALTWTPCTVVFTRANISRAIATPSASAASFPLSVAFRIRCSTSSGTLTPGTSFARNSALRRETSGQIPATIGMRNCSTRFRNASSCRWSNTGCVTANSAPASTFQAKRPQGAVGARPTGAVPRADRRGLERPARRQHRRGIHALGGNDLDARDQLAAGELRAPARLRDERRGGDPRRRLHLRAGHHHARLPRHHARDVVADLLDVLRRRAAAAAHEPRPRLDHAARIAGHVLRAREVDLPVPHVPRQPGVGLTRDRPVGDLDHPLDGLEHA